MRAALAAVAVLVAVGFTARPGAADDTVELKKLIGKWELVEKTGHAVVFELGDKGKFAVHATGGGKTVAPEGTYKLDGNRIEIEFTYEGKTVKDTLTVVKLTDTEMVTKGKNNSTETLKRVTDK